MDEGELQLRGHQMRGNTLIIIQPALPVKQPASSLYILTIYPPLISARIPLCAVTSAVTPATYTSNRLLLNHTMIITPQTFMKQHLLSTNITVVLIVQAVLLTKEQVCTYHWSAGCNV